MLLGELELGAGLKIYEQQMPDHWMTFRAKTLLGASLVGQKKYEAAEPVLKASYAGLKAQAHTIPVSSRLVCLSDPCVLLVQLYDATNRPEEAAAWRQQLNDLKKPNK